jgi:glycosyltransferase involved in cell wall biosynthesis
MIAIVIPYYKLTFFEATLESLAHQTDKRFKVYIGDDASPENPDAILDKYKRKFDFVYHRFEENLGGVSLVKQWERCISQANDEEWIMILGDDDYLEETLVETWYAHFDSFYKKTNLIRFATKTVNEKIGVITKVFHHPQWEHKTDSYYRRFKGFTRSSLSEHIFAKEPFLKYGFRDYPLAWHSDDRAWIDFSEDKPIYTINESVMFIRVSNISITGKSDNDDLKNRATVQFLKDLIKKQSGLFSKNQCLELLLEYEIAIKRYRRLMMFEWLLLFKFYLINFRLISFLKLIRRFLRSFFK